MRLRAALALRKIGEDGVSVLEAFREDGGEDDRYAADMARYVLSLDPEDVRTLGNQRERWHRGLVVTLLEHIRMLFNPRYGKIGMIVFPFYFFGEMRAPVVEVVGYAAVGAGLALGVVSWEFALLFLAMALGCLMMLVVGASGSTC